MVPFRRKIAVLLLGAVLVAPWVSAESRQENASRRPVEAWNLFARLWGALTAIWSENGCSIDPDGGCAGATGTSSTNEAQDEGCTIDPDGRCVPEVQHAGPDEGCSIDPNGGCRSGS